MTLNYINCLAVELRVCLSLLRIYVCCFSHVCYVTEIKQEAQLSLTDRAMLVCKVVEVWQDFLSEYVDKKFTHICYRRLIRHE